MLDLYTFLYESKINALNPINETMNLIKDYTLKTKNPDDLQYALEIILIILIMLKKPGL